MAARAEVLDDLGETLKARDAELQHRAAALDARAAELNERIAALEHMPAKQAARLQELTVQAQQMERRAAASQAALAEAQDQHNAILGRLKRAREKLDALHARVERDAHWCDVFAKLDTFAAEGPPVTFTFRDGTSTLLSRGFIARVDGILAALACEARQPQLLLTDQDTFTLWRRWEDGWIHPSSLTRQQCHSIEKMAAFLSVRCSCKAVFDKEQQQARAKIRAKEKQEVMRKLAETRVVDMKAEFERTRGHLQTALETANAEIAQNGGNTMMDEGKCEEIIRKVCVRVESNGDMNAASATIPELCEECADAVGYASLRYHWPSVADAIEYCARARVAQMQAIQDVQNMAGVESDCNEE